MDIPRLPFDIISKILNIRMNQKKIENEIYFNKRKYLEVIDHLEDIIETTDQIYYEANEEEEFVEEGYGFVYAMIECILEENYTSSLSDPSSFFDSES